MTLVSTLEMGDGTLHGRSVPAPVSFRIRMKRFPYPGGHVRETGNSELIHLPD